jgi:ribokinase
VARVLVVGSANIDIITRVDRLPRPGETIIGGDAVFRPGGKGANQAVAAGRLGADVSLYAAVGPDAFGRQVRTALRAEGIRLDHVQDVAGRPTGVAFIQVAADGENTIVVASGANQALDPPAVDLTPSDVAAGDVVALQLEVPTGTCAAVARAARAAGARVLLNAAPSADARDPAFSALLRDVDVLVVNEVEAAALVGTPEASTAAPAGSAGRASTPAAPDWPIVAARRLCALGPAAVVITLGARGAVGHDVAGDWIQPAFPVEAIDTTGAGDAFCGAIAAALAGGLGLRDAVRWGTAAGALATTAVGAQSALPTRAALDRMLRG